MSAALFKNKRKTHSTQESRTWYPGVKKINYTCKRDHFSPYPSHRGWSRKPTLLHLFDTRGHEQANGNQDTMVLLSCVD